MNETSVARSALTGEVPIRLWAPLPLLGLPWVLLGIWLGHARGPQSLSAFVASVALMLFLVAMATRTWRLFYLAQLPVLLVSAAFATYTLTYGTPPGDLFAYVLATSSWEEIRGFFGIWQGERLLLAGGALAATYLVLAACAPGRSMFSARARGRLVFLAVVAVLGAFAALRPVALLQGFAINPGFGTILFVAGPLAHARSAVNGTAVRKVSYGATRVLTKEVHILVIGESARRDSWSVYGYRRQTTPYLEKLQKDGEAVFFQDAVADANFTACVVPILLTGMDPGHFDMSRIRGNIVDLAEEAGYSTAWLMNQDPHISLLSGVHADRMLYPPSVSTLLNAHLPFDERLLPELRRQLDGGSGPRFIGLHIIGSHWQYDSRYPASFERFGSGKGLNYWSALSARSDPRILDAYDNSLLYTDWFLGQVIEEARKLTVPATVTYLSDHGEDIYALDGQAGHGTSTYSKHQFEIPAFIWMNAAYRSTHPDKVRAIKENADKEIRSHNVFFSEADVMGIQWPGAKPSQSYASPGFVPDTESPLIAGGVLVSPAE